MLGEIFKATCKQWIVVMVVIIYSDSAKKNKYYSLWLVACEVLQNHVAHKRKAKTLKETKSKPTKISLKKLCKIIYPCR